MQRVDAAGLWSEIEAEARRNRRTIKMSTELAAICRSIAWRDSRRVAVSWLLVVTSIMWLSIPFDYLVVPDALDTIVLGHGCLTTVAVVVALASWRRLEWQVWQGLTACFFVSAVMIAAVTTGHRVGGPDFERFVVIGFFGMATGVPLLPLSTRWTALATLSLNVTFMVSQFINPNVDGSSGLLFTLYCSAITGALVWTRSQINVRQARAILLRLAEARTSRLMKEMAHTDGLTGLQNRKAITEDFARILQETPAGTALSVAMIDVDDFKRLNDSLGHAAGDQALRSLGSLFSSLSKTGRALCGRIGGEEFLLLLPGATADVARDTIERLMRDLDQMKLSNPGSRVADRVTLSVGLVTTTIGGNEPSHPESLMRYADLALYEAKNAGRNRIVSVAASAA